MITLTKLKPPHFLIVLITLATFLGVNASYSQVNSIDSLTQLISKEKNHEQKIDLLNQLAQERVVDKPDEAIATAREALYLSKQKRKFKHLPNTYLVIGDAYQELGFQDSTTHYYEQSIKWSTKNADEFFFEDGLNKMLVIYRTEKKTHEALHWLDSLRNTINEDFVMGKMLIDLYATTLLYYTGRIEECIDICRKNFAIANEIENTDKAVLWTLYLSSFLYEFGNYEGATKTVLEGLKLANDYPISDFDLFRLKSNLSIFYTATEQYKKADEILQEVANNYCKKNYDAIECANAMANLGNNAAKMKNYDDALNFFQQAISHAQTVDYNNVIAYGKYNLGMVFQETKNFKGAIENFSEAIELSEKISDVKMKAASLIGLGAVQIELGNGNKALVLIEEGLAISTEISNLELQKEAHRLLHKLHTNNKSYQKALQSHIRYTLAKDSLFSQEKTKEILRLQTQYEVLEKDKQLEIQTLRLDQTQKQARTLAIIGGLSVALISLVFLAFYQKRKRANLSDRLALLNLKETALYNQISEHFLSNSIARIYYLLKLGQEREAEDYAKKFSDYLKRNIYNIRQEKVSLHQELELISNFVDIEQLKGKGFEFCIDVSEKVNLEEVMVPPLFIQPIVENALKHGISTKSDGEGRICVCISREEPFVAIVVEDNGAGFLNPDNIKTGLGLRITEERLALLNKKNSIRFEPVNTGARVVIHLYQN